MLNRYIGDRAFYRTAMTVAVPIMVQNFITNFVGMLDNIMVGRIGTAPMSGVSIVNQLVFIFHLCLFGMSSGAGIFTAQYHGNRDSDGVRYTVRYKLVSALLICAVGFSLFSLVGDRLIALFLTGEGAAEEAAAYLDSGLRYLAILRWGFVPFALSNVYSSTLRQCGESLVSMKAGIIAVLVNLCLNWVLIFGKLGFPALGVEGAALATVISRFAELGIVLYWTHRHPERMPFVRGLWRSLAMPAPLAANITRKGLPLLANEALWSAGLSVLTWCYSLRALAVVGAVNIANSLTNTMSISFFAMGEAIGILIGQRLGAAEPAHQVLDATRKLMVFSLAFAAVSGLLQFLIAPFFPLLYNTTAEIQALAAGMLRIAACLLPFRSFTNASYFVLRSGGKTMVTFLFDSCFVWAVTVPTAFLLARFTPLPILLLYGLTEATECVKCLVGYAMLRSRRWLNRLV